MLAAQNGRTPLLCAAYFGRPLKVIRYLVEECGASLTAVNEDNETALHEAATNDDIDVVKYLVEKGGSELVHAKTSVRGAYVSVWDR